MFQEYDFWLLTTSVNHPADVMIAPPVKLGLIRHLNTVKMPFSVLIDNIGEKTKCENSNLKYVETPPAPEFFAAYQDIEDINEYMDILSSKHPDFVSVVEVGTSYEGRSLKLLKISAKTDEVKPAIWIQAGAHAREQIGPATVLYMAEMLATLNNQCDQVSRLIAKFDWYILPVLNPDGYEYCQKYDRLWRKTRSRHPNSGNCIGVDANRNWDARWNVATGSSSNPCSHNYAGPRAFSEPETKSTSDFMLQELQGRLRVFLDFHSYSQRWLTPWGYSADLPPNYQQQKRLADIATTALQNVSGTKYSVGSTGTIFYTVTGGARDWAYDVVGAQNSYVIELKDKGEFGFVLPKRHILPTANETWIGVKAMALDLIENLKLK
ncbi:hypothetical protein JTE90_023987 [Oedothorax gibbosus]|uniref:Peptidase M14 domain-containing protein n=1 Tax=Oedothorax gibbosus TaxID=931172 RepID=A0AAV6UHS5_9ARAC|nr:hypothetical protein JTE90_023987 [Oedothorax gibbosus]